jgi:hypothetical protein
MKILSALLLLVMLSGCDTVYKKPEFPKPPKELMAPVPELKKL